MFAEINLPPLVAERFLWPLSERDWPDPKIQGMGNYIVFPIKKTLFEFILSIYLSSNEKLLYIYQSSLHFSKHIVLNIILNLPENQAYVKHESYLLC